MLPPPLPPDLFDSLPSVVQAYILALEALTARVAELEARLNQNSSNSSKPPSSDGPHVKPAPPTPPSGQRRGGQPGHPRDERVILPPDELCDHKPTSAAGAPRPSSATTRTRSSIRCWTCR
jgi:transposase